ncbi:UrcA family protein [Sphingomicrobium arenosum]|uniref:UrcA family protein n=1 Tax=Sphingomicrobium arenosum TaxID=2233861 RepID=UPI0022403136|nr:UrcA family protein [Sphingomicrobium arenosum]
MKHLLIACGGLALVAAPAVAGDPIEVIASDDAVEARVYHGDLDLQSKAGNGALKARVTNAARKLCLTPGVQPLNIWQDERSCYSTAKADGFAQADAFYNAPRGSVIVQTMVISGR